MNTKTIQSKYGLLKSVLVAEYTHLDSYKSVDELQQQKQNYFLICQSCFWMASTLSHLKLNNNSPAFYKECQICESKIDEFSILDLNCQI